MTDIRIMLVDDHEMIRTGLRAYLNNQSGFSVVAETGSGEQALQLVQEHHPDIVVMDISMPGMDGLQATRLIKSICSECKVLALTVHADKQYFFKMLASGAEGYVTKQAAADELVIAIRAVAEGNVYLQPPLALWLLEDYRRISESAPLEQSARPMTQALRELEVLSHRERQVLELVAEGYNNNEIGEMLGISPKTVARHRERIMGKLDLHSCSELVKFAIRSGLIGLQ